MAGSLASFEVVVCIVFGGLAVVLMVEACYIFHSRHGYREERNPSARATGFILNRAFGDFLGTVYCGRRLKDGIGCLIDGGKHEEDSVCRNRLPSNANNSNQDRTTIAMDGAAQASSSIFLPSAALPPSMHSELFAELFPVQRDFCEDGDMLQLQAFLGPPRLLFTIKEETKDDLESGDTKSRAGMSRGASRASSELIPLPDGPGTATPFEASFVTPPSSPFLTSPITSPPLPPLQSLMKQDGEEGDADDAPCVLKLLNILPDESSSSLSSSSSENFTSPIHSYPPKIPSTKETSSSSSSSTATPFLMSPQHLVISQNIV